MTEKTRAALEAAKTELEHAVGEETAAAAALAALEDAAASGRYVDAVDLAAAAGEVTLRRLRRQRLEGEVDASRTALAGAERRAAIEALAARAGTDQDLDADRLKQLEQVAKAAVQQFHDAVQAGVTSFGRLSGEARALGLPVVSKSDPATDALVASFTQRTGVSVVYGDPNRVRLRGVDYQAPRPNAFRDFERWVGGLLN